MKPLPCKHEEKGEPEDLVSNDKGTAKKKLPGAVEERVGFRINKMKKERDRKNVEKG